MSGFLSPWELLILLLVVLLVFGPKRLPEMGRGLGRGMREFRDSISGRDEKRALEQQQDAAARVEPTRTLADSGEQQPAAAPRDRDSVA